MPYYTQDEASPRTGLFKSYFPRQRESCTQSLHAERCVCGFIWTRSPQSRHIHTVVVVAVEVHTLFFLRVIAWVAFVYCIQQEAEQGYITKVRPNKQIRGAGTCLCRKYFFVGEQEMSDSEDFGLRRKSSRK